MVIMLLWCLTLYKILRQCFLFKALLDNGNAGLPWQHAATRFNSIGTRVVEWMQIKSLAVE